MTTTTQELTALGARMHPDPITRRKPESARKSAWLSLRLRKTKRAKYDAAAAAAGDTLAGWVESACDRAAKRKVKVEVAL